MLYNNEIIEYTVSESNNMELVTNSIKNGFNGLPKPFCLNYRVNLHYRTIYSNYNKSILK
ncbi:hypothetical protein Ob7_04247 [Thermosipho africanus Ob7]|nr:hypothetical protein Ob7_04247 [Thermosipho africanus Ob7]